jgi:hypothetical protein
MLMKASDIGRELIYPLSNMAIVFAMIFFWLLLGLAQSARLFGIALLFLAVPAYLRYLLYLLEARANGRSAPVPEITMFNPADNFWTLTPLIYIAAGVWTGILLENVISVIGIILIAVAALLIVPASMAVLAVTHSPAESLNPLAMVRMIRACGASYFVVPIVLCVLSCLFVALYLAGVPLFLIDLGTSYQAILLFTMTGTVLHVKNVAVQVEIPGPVEPTAEELARDLEEERQTVANHAYGFISRGNREGGFAHVRQWLNKESDVEQAYQWFFREMLKWENTDPALFFAQEYLRRLLRWRMDNEALKLVVRCLHENERWRPRQEDREEVNELLSQQGREDLVAELNNQLR